jgi:hypothetical protein
MNLRGSRLLTDFARDRIMPPSHSTSQVQVTHGKVIPHLRVATNMTSVAVIRTKHRLEPLELLENNRAWVEGTGSQTNGVAPAGKSDESERGT